VPTAVVIFNERPCLEGLRRTCVLLFFCLTLDVMVTLSNINGLHVLVCSREIYYEYYTVYPSVTILLFPVSLFNEIFSQFLFRNFDHYQAFLNNINGDTNRR
jgi:hypothetical protein